MTELSNIPQWLQILVVVVGSGGIGGLLTGYLKTRSSVKLDEYDFLIKSWQGRVDEIKKDWVKTSADMAQLEELYLKTREENASLKSDIRSLKEENLNLKGDIKLQKEEIKELRVHK